MVLAAKFTLSFAYVACLLPCLMFVFLICDISACALTVSCVLQVFGVSASLLNFCLVFMLLV